MASITVDLPEPVGPTSANRSVSAKSTSVSSRKAPKPSHARAGPAASGRPRRCVVEQLGEQGDEALVLDVALGEVLRGTARRAVRPARSARHGAAPSSLGRRPRGRRRRRAGAARTSSARPARAGSRDDDPQRGRRRGRRPCAASSATVPVTVRSRRGAVSGTGATAAGAPGRASTSSTCRRWRPPRRSRPRSASPRTRSGAAPASPGRGGGGRGRRSDAVGGEHVGRHVVLEDALGLALAAAERAAA